MRTWHIRVGLLEWSPDRGSACKNLPIVAIAHHGLICTCIYIRRAVGYVSYYTRIAKVSHARLK
jgi:hypothetical protein